VPADIFECTGVMQCGVYIRNANKVPNGPAILDNYRPSRTALARPPMPAARKVHWQVPVSPGIAHMRTQPGSVARHAAMQLANKRPNTTKCAIPRPLLPQLYGAGTTANMGDVLHMHASCEGGMEKWNGGRSAQRD